MNGKKALGSCFYKVSSQSYTCLFFIEENEVLAASRDKALQRIGDMSMNSQDVQQR